MTPMLDNTEHARGATHKHVDIFETEDGDVSIRCRGRELAAMAFEKEGHVRQAATVKNEELSAPLQHAKQLQEERAATKLQGRMTKRERRLLEERRVAATDTEAT